MTLQVIGNEISNTDIRILKENTCSSLSDQSTIKYQIGKTTESEILLRICNNSGAGKFNNEWIPSKDIMTLIKESPFYSSVLIPLYEKKSVNSAGFLLAILKHEGLVQSVDGGGYERTRKDINSLLSKSRSRRAA